MPLLGYSSRYFLRQLGVNDEAELLAAQPNRSGSGLDRRRVNQIMTHTVNQPGQQLRTQAEIKLQQDQNTARKAVPPETENPVLHELRVHQVELEMQNEELRRTQLELEVSRSRYFDLYNLAPVGYLTLNDQGFIVEVNLTSTNLLGVVRAKLIQRQFSSFIVSEDQDRYYLFRKQLTGKGQLSHGCELRMVRADNSFFWVHLQAIPARNADGSSECRMAMSDCTRQRLLEQEIRQSEEKFRTIADYTYNWEYWMSPRMELLYCSPSCKGLTGFSAEEFMADPKFLVSIVHPDDRDSVVKHMGCTADTSQEAMHFTFRIITKEGVLRWIAHSCQPVFSSGGRFLGRRASNRNITREKLIEEQITRSEERLRLALDASSDGVWDRNLVTNEVYYGENWHTALGYTKLDVKQKSLRWEQLLHPEDRAQTMTAIQQHLDELTSHYEAEFRMRNKAGQWQWFLSRGKVVEKSEAGTPLRFIGTHSDITKNKTNELKLQDMHDLLEKKVAERTNEIVEVNIALKVLLKKMEQDTRELEQRIADNITRLIDPYLKKLQGLSLDPQHRIIVEMLTANLQELTSAFTCTASSKLNKLTPTELQVANMVGHGKNTKEIAETMHLAPGTISIHRKNIRKKLGISQQKTNLQSYLSFST